MFRVCNCGEKLVVLYIPNMPSSLGFRGKQQYLTCCIKGDKKYTYIFDHCGGAGSRHHSNFSGFGLSRYCMSNYTHSFIWNYLFMPDSQCCYFYYMLVKETTGDFSSSVHPYLLMNISFTWMLGHVLWVRTKCKEISTIWSWRKMWHLLE